MIVVNGAEYDFDGLMVEELLSALGVQPRGIAVARNGEVIRRSAWTTTSFVSGDRVEIVTAVAGG